MVPRQLKHLAMLKLPKAVLEEGSTEICMQKKKNQECPHNRAFNWILHGSAIEEYTSLSVCVKMSILVQFFQHKSAQILMLKVV